MALIKFREVALRGAHKRTRVDKQGRITKVVYDARLTPPRWNGEAVPKLELGQFATEQEAHNKFLIAAFYYNRDAGLLDGWFQVPPMNEEEQSFTGLRLREWVIGQAKKVYEDFKKEAAALLLEELSKAWENEEMPKQDEGLAFSNSHSLGFEEGFALPTSQLPPNIESDVGVNNSEQWDLFQIPTPEASLLNLAEHQLPLLVSPAENPRMAIARLDNQGLEYTLQSFGGMLEGFVTSTGHSLGFEEESVIPIPQLTRDAQSGMCINNSNQLNVPQVTHNEQELISYLQQHLEESRICISQLEYQQRIHQQHLEESRIRISQLEYQQRTQQQQLEESRIHISQLESQHFVQQQLQVINEGVSSLDVEMEPSMPQQNHPCRPRDSAFW